MHTTTWSAARRQGALYTGAAVLAGFIVVGPTGLSIAEAIDLPSATITGSVFVDTDGDGIRDEAEEGLAGVPVSDGKAFLTTDADGRYELSIETERRGTDIVYATQPRGYEFGVDKFGEPLFFKSFGQLSDGATATADFAVTRESKADRGKFSFANIADPHVNAQLPDQIREINSTANDIRFIAVSGDLTNSATQAHFDYYRNATAGSEIPVWPAVGNHEYASGSTYGARIENYRRNVGPEWYSFNYGNRHFIVLENNGAAPVDEQFAWAQADLATVPDDMKVVVLVHQPMNVPFGGSSAYDKFGDLLEQHGTELILVGHEHSNHVEWNSDFVDGAKHIQTVSSSYTIDNAPRGFRYVHMTDTGFTNPFRMYGENEHLTVVSPAPGTTVSATGFPGIQINAYDTGDEVTSARFRIDGGSWRPVHPSGEFTWWSAANKQLLPEGDHTLEVSAKDEAGKTWTEEVDFTVSEDAREAIVPGADWTQHHGDAAHTGATGAQDAGRVLAWSYRTEGTFLTGSPVIQDGVVYAGTRDENGEGNSRIHAVDMVTGKKLWDFEVPQSIHGSLAVADGLVFAPTLGSELYAVDAKSGELKWQAAPEEAPEPNNQRTYGYYAPTVEGHTVIWPYQTRYGIGTAGVIKALDSRTGEQIWASPMSGNQMSDGTAAVEDGVVYVGNQTADRVLAYDLATGKQLWTGPTALGSWQDGVPTAAGGRVFIGADNGISARDAKTGQILWIYRSPHTSMVSSGATPSAPAVKGDVVYMGFPSGAVTALDARTGAVIWDRVLPGDIYHGGIASSPVVAGDNVFVGSNNGNFYALAADTGQPLWNHEIGTWVGAGPAVSGNTIVAGAWDGNLYAYVPGGKAAQRWGSVAGIVTDPATGEPIDGAKVTATADGQSAASTTTNTEGRYTIGLQAGDWAVTATKRGLLADDRSTAKVTIGETGSVEANVQLEKVTGPVAGITSIAPDYGSGSTRTDVVAGDRYHYVANDKVRATITSRTAANNVAGGFAPGALSDLMLNDTTGMETLDWAEMTVQPKIAGDGWGRSGNWLTLPEISVDGRAVVASGEAQNNAALKTTMRYETLPDAPVVKLTLSVKNAGATDYAGYFNYQLDPDSSSDVGRVPGLSGTNPGLKTSGWTKDFVYVGADAPNDQPAHGVAWAEDQPAAVGVYGYIDGAWWDVSVAAGATKEITFYHVTDYAAAGDPTANIARWVDDLDLLDPELPDQVRLTGRVTSADTALSGIRVKAKAGDEVVGTASTDAEGRFALKPPAGEYTVAAAGLGFQSESATVAVPEGQNGTADFDLAPVTVEAGTDKRLRGSLVEAGFDDIVLENDQLSVAIAKVFNDGQLPGSTAGKVVDGAVRGRDDQLDWLNITYATPTQPTGGNAWQQPQVQPKSVEVVEAGGEQAVVRTTGTISGMAGLTATTTYTLRPGDTHITVDTVFDNAGTENRHVWVGDSMDHDAAGQKSGVAGHPPITLSSGTPDEFAPDGRWIAMTGNDPQVYGLVYADAAGAFTGYAATNFSMSRFEVDIPSGGSYTLSRKLVIAEGTDMAAVLDTIQP